MNANCKLRRQRGFSLVELLVVVAIIFIASGMAIIGYVSQLDNNRANSAAYTISGALRAARQAAITNRRDVQVWIDQTFTGGDNVQHVNYQIQPKLGIAEPAHDIVSFELPTQTQYQVFAGVPDTPMAFGNSAAVYINGQSGGPNTMAFASDGSFNNGLASQAPASPISGTIFVGIPNKTNTARAVTIMGGTGRVRTYTWTGTQWAE